MELRKFIKTTIREFLNEQEDQIQSNINDNFWKWFGNSKVINRDGSPMIVYHGTKADFNTFKIGKDIVGSGIFLLPIKIMLRISHVIQLKKFQKLCLYI